MEETVIAAGTVGRGMFGKRGLNRVASVGAFVGQMIKTSNYDRQKSLSKLSHEISTEIRSLNYTLAAIAISNQDPAARCYLSQVVDEGIREHQERGKRKRTIAKLEAAYHNLKSE